MNPRGLLGWRVLAETVMKKVKHGFLILLERSAASLFVLAKQQILEQRVVSVHVCLFF